MYYCIVDSSGNVIKKNCSVILSKNKEKLRKYIEKMEKVGYKNCIIEPWGNYPPINCILL